MLATQAVTKKWSAAILIITLVFMLPAGSFILMPGFALAEVSEPLTITGDGVAKPITLTLEQLQAMRQYQHIYSTINTWPTKVVCVGEGVRLRDLLALAEIKEDAQLISFTSTDDYKMTLMVKELLEDKRYYFPHLMDNNAGDGSIAGSPADAEEVEPILALKSTRDSIQPADMNDMDALLLMFGQRAVTEQTQNLFVRYVKTIEVLTTAPQKWDNPIANIDSGDVLAGTSIELSNKRNDADKIYYTTDGSTPTINSPIYNLCSKRWWGQRPNLELTNKPIEIKQGTVIKARTIGPGKADSDVVTFTYQIGSPTQSQTPSGPPSIVTLDQKLVDSKVGSIVELTATVGPKNATDTRVTWSSNDTRVATVDSYGLVTIVGLGTATITVKTVTGNLTATCIVQGTMKNVVGLSRVDTDIDPNKNEVSKLEQSNPAVMVAAIKHPITPDHVQATASQDVVGQSEADTDTDTDTDTVQEPSPASQQSQTNWQHLTAKENVATNSTNPQTSDSELDRQAWQVYEILPDVGPLLLSEEYDRLSIYLWIILGSLFFSGAGRRYRKYRKYT